MFSRSSSTVRARKTGPTPSHPYPTTPPTLYLELRDPVLEATINML